jgi:Secretion system C-terminal sorting domain
MKRLLWLILILTNTSIFCIAQSVTPAVVNIAGNSYQHRYYVLEWSIGELAIVDQMKSSQGNLIISNGFLQPFTHNPALINVAAQFGPEEIKILPNPTKDIVEINLLTAQKGKVSFELVDATGRIVYVKEFDSYGYGRIEHIDLRRMTGGAYFLKIELAALTGFVSKRGSYKIIKLN